LNGFHRDFAVPLPRPPFDYLRVGEKEGVDKIECPAEFTPFGLPTSTSNCSSLLFSFTHVSSLSRPTPAPSCYQGCMTRPTTLTVPHWPPRGLFPVRAIPGPSEFLLLVLILPNGRVGRVSKTSKGTRSLLHLSLLSVFFVRFPTVPSLLLVQSLFFLNTACFWVLLLLRKWLKEGSYSQKNGLILFPSSSPCTFSKIP